MKQAETHDLAGPNAPATLSIALAGDVMLGRGIDQVLPHPCEPGLYEPNMRSAAGYVALAEAANGPIPRPVDFAYLWGDALGELAARRPDCRLVNLETAVTRSPEPMPKGINYRMSPENFPAVAAAGIDCCALANNHLLDWGSRGLSDTLAALRRSAVRGAGAGENLAAAAAPAVLPLPGAGRLLVFAYGLPSGGVPKEWAATETNPGVNFLPDLSRGSRRRIEDDVRAARRPGDIVLLSVHWGSNWGYGVSSRQRRFAHRLIDRGVVDILHGHSSHHPRPIEVYRGRLILYGCGDLLNDYEGIKGYASFRGDLALLYFATLERSSGSLAALTMVPYQIRKFRLNRAASGDAAWLRSVLDRESRAFGSRVELDPAGSLALAWNRPGAAQ